MARIRAKYSFQGAKPGASQAFVASMKKKFPNTFNHDERSGEVALSVKGAVTRDAVKTMLKSHVPAPMVISYQFRVDVDGSRFEFEGC